MCFFMTPFLGADYDNTCWNGLKCTLAGLGRCHSAGPCCFINSVLCYVVDGYECGYSVEEGLESKVKEAVCVCLSVCFLRTG